MKKKFLFLFLITCLFVGCHSKMKEPFIEGIIENSPRIGIHYPVTNIKELDEKTKEYILNIKKKFTHEFANHFSLKGIPELNIDYEYTVIGNRYYNILFAVFIDSPTLAHPINEIKTFVYDSVEKKFLTVEDISSLNIGKIKEELLTNYKDCILLTELNNTITKENLQNIKFTFTNDFVTLYFNPYEITSGNCNIIKLKIPHSNLKIEIEKEEINHTFDYKPVYKNLSITKPTIALTFDDGPSKYTKQIVELVNKYNARATFFILGNKVKNYEETLKYVLSNGNELGNHSYNHKDLTKLSKEDLYNQIDMTNQVVKDTLNYDIKLLRPTYGSITKNLQKKIEMDIILWNVDTYDWKLRNAKKIADKTLTDIKDGKVVLMHDIYETTYESLKIILPELEKQGYQIVTVSELKEIERLRNESKE